MKRLTIDGTKPRSISLKIENNNSPWGWFVEAERLIPRDEFERSNSYMRVPVIVDFLRRYGRGEL